MALLSEKEKGRWRNLASTLRLVIYGEAQFAVVKTLSVIQTLRSHLFLLRGQPFSLLSTALFGGRSLRNEVATWLRQAVDDNASDQGSIKGGPHESIEVSGIE